MQNGRLNSTPIIALVLAAACWGAATVITKHVLTDIPPLTLLVLQLTVSVVFLWAIVLVQRLHLPQGRDIVGSVKKPRQKWQPVQQLCEIVDTGWSR